MVPWLGKDSKDFSNFIDLGHGARDQVTVSKQLEAGCPDLGLKPANADPARVCGTVEE